MKVITIANQKGGSGKTCTAANLAEMIAGDGFRVLCIDLNDQSDLTETMGARPGGECVGLFTGKDPAKLVRESNILRVELIPAGDEIALLDVKLKESGRERALLLGKALKPLRRSYRYCIIDAPGTFNTALLNALAVSDYVIIPTQADVFSLKGIRRMIANIRQVRETVNPDLKIAGILLTRYQGRRNLSKETIELLQAAEKTTGATLFKSTIRESVKIAEAPGHKKTVIAYAPSSNGAADYKAFYKELQEILSEGKDR